MGWFSNSGSEPQMTDQEIKDLEAEAKSLRAAQARVSKQADQMAANGTDYETWMTARQGASSFGSEASAYEDMVGRARRARRG